MYILCDASARRATIIQTRPPFNGMIQLALLCLGLLSMLASSGVTADPSGTQCEAAPGRDESCVCQTEGGVIDLTPLSNTDRTPRYK